MPFLVETLHASSVESDYSQLEETLGFKIHASISKGTLGIGKSRSFFHPVLSKRVKEGCLASSVGIACGCQSRGCEFKPHFGCRDYLKIKLRGENVFST